MPQQPARAVPVQPGPSAPAGPPRVGIPALSEGLAVDDITFPYNGVLVRLRANTRFTADRELRRFINRQGFAVLWDDEP